MICTIKIEIKKFDGAVNFSLWQIQIIDLLVHNGLEAAIKEEDSANSNAYLKGLDKKALYHSFVPIKWCIVGDTYGDDGN